MDFNETLDKIVEGRTKRALEDKIEKMCTCDGGCSLDADEHDDSCPAKKAIKTGDTGDIDAAEYRMSDR